MYEGQLKAVLGECRGSELRDSDLTVLASVLVISRLGYNFRYQSAALIGSSTAQNFLVPGEVSI